MISVVTPVYNEVDNLDDLHQQLTRVLEQIDGGYEILAVDDGSTDGSRAKLAELAAKDERFKVVELRRNFGQTAAMLAGIRYARGEVIVPIDADLQNDPEDIPRLLAKLDQGWDIVSGWRKDRQDARFRRVMISRVANAVISWATGVRLHDYGCSLKAYRAEVIKPLKIYGEMHRFLPVHASWQGAKVTEMPVNHRARTRGVSKYGLERVLKVILDLIIVKFMGDYFTKPIYVFGKAAVLCLGIAFFAGCYAVYLKFFGGEGFGPGPTFIETPLPILVAMMFIASLLCLLLGITTELLVRTYFEAAGKEPFLVGTTRNCEAGEEAV